MGKRQPEKTLDTRELALSMLMEIETGKEHSHLVIRNVLNKYDYLEAGKKAFMKRVVEGTLERQLQLDYVIGCYSKVPIHKMKPLIRCLLRMGTYQILFMDQVPDSAVCNEAVKLAQKRSFHALKGFVNGVLRTISRQKESVPYPDREKDPEEYLSVAYSMPRWLVEKWTREQGMETTEHILRGLLKEHAVTVRLREGLPQTEKDRLYGELQEKGVRVMQSPLPCAFRITGVEGLMSVRAFREGWCTVQDISSILAVEAAGIREGDFVLDVCAAPGGKAVFAAEKAGGTGHVLARDLSGYKAGLVEENRERMRVDNLEIQVWDACDMDESLEGKADVVLADVPCSGLGVIGKKPDIKYRVTQESIDSLLILQKKILGTVWRYVKPDGVLLFSTCTINRQENEEMAEWLIKNFPLEAESIEPFLPETIQSEDKKNGFVQLLPGVHDTDGFFLARFRRKA